MGYFELEPSELLLEDHPSELWRAENACRGPQESSPNADSLSSFEAIPRFDEGNVRNVQLGYETQSDSIAFLALVNLITALRRQIEWVDPDDCFPGQV